MSLPNFMCLGAAKSGTTSLYDILRQHADIYIPSFKEPHFFDIPENFSNGLEWYEKVYFKNADKKIIADFFCDAHSLVGCIFSIYNYKVYFFLFY